MIDRDSTALKQVPAKLSDFHRTQVRRLCLFCRRYNQNSCTYSKTTTVYSNASHHFHTRFTCSTQSLLCQCNVLHYSMQKVNVAESK